MFCQDQETFNALNALDSAIRSRGRPLVVWLGAGASAWAGYPLWGDLADRMHRRFAREVSTYAKNTGSALLGAEEYPKLFQEMRTSNSALYFSCLVGEFAYRQPNPVYARLLRALQQVEPTGIVTTNVDESLERHLSGRETIQRSDVERMAQLLAEGRAFTCKLHGSISAVETMVFSEQDYEDVRTDVPFLNALHSLLAGSMVLFLGYGLRDRHVISALQQGSATHPLFGTGPHFIVAPQGTSEDLPHVKRISYVVDPPDHRSALFTVEAVAGLRRQLRATASVPEDDGNAERNGESTYFIGDLLPPGTSITSQTLIAEGKSGTRELIVGEGYVDGEVVVHDYSALHDVVVGLVCFDVVCLSIAHLGKLYDLLGSVWFWAFVEAGAIRLVNPPPDPVVVFPEPGVLVGDIKAYTSFSKASSRESFEERTIAERIRQHLKPVPGREDAAERQMDALESSTVDLGHALTSDQVGERTRSAMMHPSIRRLLGISGGTPPGAVPRWLAFPVLRLAGVVLKGVICQKIGANATRLVLGSESLASVAFSASAGREWVDDAASYALTGRFNSDLGALIEQQPDLLGGVLRFRESAGGTGFRREVAERLATNEGGQVMAAVNGGLREALPASVLQQAQDQLSGLFMPQAAGPRLRPAVWGDLRNADIRVARWRKRSRTLLEGICTDNKLNPYDVCPCGSGERIKFCCRAAVR